MSVGRSTALMAVGTLLSRITGFLRTGVFLWFGTVALTETYVKANNTPNLIFELVIGGVLSATLVPLFVDLNRSKHRQHGDRTDTNEGINAIVSLVSVVLLAAVVLVIVAAPLLMWIVFRKPGDALQREVGTTLLRMFAPQVGVYGFVTIATAMLNARRSFLAPMIAPVLNNLVVIVVLIWARRVVVHLVPDKTIRLTDKLATLRAVATDGTAKALFGFGTTAGVVAMGLALFVPWLRGGMRIAWHWNPRHAAVKKMIRLSGWTFGYVAANVVAAQFVAGALPGEGKYAAYNLAFSAFFMLPHGVFAVSVMTALQPELAEAYLERKRGIFRKHLTSGMRTIFAITTPAAAGYLALAPSIMRLLRFGDLDNNGAQLIAGVLRCFVVGLPAFSIYLLLMNACKAMLDTRATFTINCVENAINIVLAGLFVRLGLGVQGLALSYAFAYIAAAILAAVYVSNRTRGLHGAALRLFGLRVLTASSAMGVFAWTAARLLHSILNGRFAIIEVGAAAVLGVSFYAAAGRALGIPEIESVLRSITRRLRPRPPRKSAQVS